MGTASPTSVTFLSWNMCLLGKSHQAPANWRMDQSEDLIRRFVLDKKPDFVFFQELPGLVPFVETHDMVPVNTTSHSGNIASLVKKELADSVDSYAVGRFAVCTKLNSLDLTLANVHLEPGRNGSYQRLKMIQTIASKCQTKGLLIVGDTNTRVEEEDDLASIGMLGERPPAATWDTKINKYRDDGKKYSAYFTRYFHNAAVLVSDVKVWDQPFEENGAKFFLSDHFAMSGKASVIASD